MYNLASPLTKNRPAKIISLENSIKVFFFFLIIAILHNLFQKNRRGETLTNSFYETSITHVSVSVKTPETQKSNREDLHVD